MDKPLEAAKDRALSLRFRQLLSSETQAKVLLNLPTEKLIAMCLENKEGICEDYPFWKEKLKVDGFDIRDHFEDFIDKLKYEEMSRAEFIRQFFYSKGKSIEESFLRELSKFWSLVYNITNQTDTLPFYEEIQQDIKRLLFGKIPYIQQLYLDFRYYQLQAQEWKERKDDKPRVFSLGAGTIIEFSIPQLNQISWDEFRSFEIQRDMSVFLDSFPGFDFESYEEIPRNNIVVRTALSIIELENIQLLDTIGWLLKEGDIVIIHKSTYYVNEKDDQLWLTDFDEYLPEEAVPFLIKKNVHNLKDLEKLYNNKLDVRGFIWKDQRYSLALEDDPYSELVIDGHSFHLLKKKEPKAPYAPVKRKPLVRKK